MPSTSSAASISVNAALNTFGNAIETKRWASEHNFNSLIIVTSNWHMPRAMTELERQLPDTRLIAYPVISGKLKRGPWWTNRTPCAC